MISLNQYKRISNATSSTSEGFSLRRFGFVTSTRSRAAFTLVELLVVIVIIGILMSMVTVAIQGVTASARASRTRTIVSLIDSVIQEKYASYQYRSLPVEIPVANYANGITGSTLSFEVIGAEAARARLNMIRDLQRLEMPDRFADFQTAPATIRASASRVLIDTGDLDGDGDTTEIIRTRQNQTIRYSSRVAFPLSWYGTATLPSLAQAYQRRVTAGASTLNQSAECLYLIMAMSYSSGTPAIDAIPTSNIGDTDGDGMFEILDGWGNPIGFIRWPVGYSDPDAVINTALEDEFDLFRTDFYHTDGVDTTIDASHVVPAIDVNSGSTVAPWALTPLIISAGEDNTFGISFDPVDDSGAVLGSYSYVATSWNWPKNVENMGVENEGRGTPSYPWVDPYLRRFIAANDPGDFNRSSGSYATSRRLPGEALTLAPDDSLADNITNLGLQVTQ